MIVISALLGVPLMGFTLYWIAQFLELKVEERKKRISEGEARALKEEVATLRADLDQLRGSEERLLALEEQVAFVEGLLQGGASRLPLPPPGRADDPEPTS